MTPRPNFMPNAILILFLLFLSACLSPSGRAPAPTAAPIPTVTGTAAPALTPIVTQTPAPTETPTLLPTPTPAAVTVEEWQGMPQADREAWFAKYDPRAIGMQEGDKWEVLKADGLVQVITEKGEAKYFNVFTGEWVQTLEVGDYHRMGSAVIIPIERQGENMVQFLLDNPDQLPALDAYIDSKPYMAQTKYGILGQGFLVRFVLADVQYSAVDVGNDGSIDGYQADCTFVYRLKGQKPMTMRYVMRGTVYLRDHEKYVDAFTSIRTAMNGGLLRVGKSYLPAISFVPKGSKYTGDSYLKQIEDTGRYQESLGDMQFLYSDFGEVKGSWVEATKLLEAGEMVVDGGESGYYATSMNLDR